MRHIHFIYLSVAVMAYAAGCSGDRQGSSTASAGTSETEARAAFSSLQAALKAHDSVKLWTMLASESQADAERAAKQVKDDYAKADAARKAEHEKALGLTGAELAALDGRGFVKSKRFLGKYEELPESKLDKVVVQGDSATATYVEEDGDREKLTLVRDAGQWKVSLPMPKGG